MSTSPVVQITKGAATVSLTSGVPFAVNPEFQPPPAQLQPLMVEQGGRLIKLYEKLLPRTWSVSVAVGGNTSMSDARVRRAVNSLDRRLREAGDSNEPTYFEFNQNSDVPEPLWGTYGANLRYEIISGRVILPEEYGVADLRGVALDCTMEMLIVPYAANKQQRLATATGGMIPDMLGVTDGAAAGWYVPEATTNIIPNPIFANSTATTGWTAQSSLIAQTVNDKDLCYPGSQTAVELAATASTNNAYVIGVTSAAVTYVVTLYVRKRDGSAVTSADVSPWEGSAPTVGAAFGVNMVMAVRNGWYRVVSSKYTGAAGARYYGAAVGNGKNVILGAIQVEAKNYWTPLACGDMVGHAWGGTAHNSTSARTVANLSLTQSIVQYNRVAGALRLVTQYPVASTASNTDTPGGGAPMFFATVAGAGFQSYIDKTNNTVYLEMDGGTNIRSAAISWTAGQTDVWHFVWGPSGIVIYRNGASLISGTYALSALAQIWIGQRNGSFNGNFLFTDAATWDVELTAAQALADYTNLSTLTGAGERIAPIPFYWAVAGAYTGYSLFAGIPGTLPAYVWGYTGLYAYTTNELAFINRYSMPLDGFYPPPNLTQDLSGTVVGGALGGQVQTLAALSTTAVDLTTLTFAGSVDKRWLWNQRIRAIAPLTDAGANLVMALKVVRNTSSYTDYYPVDDQPFTVYAITPEIRIQPAEYAINTISLAVSLKRTVAAAANVQVDFYKIIVGDLLRVRLGIGGSSRYYISSSQIAFMSYGGGAGPITMSEPIVWTGDPFYFEPERWNVVNSFVYSGGTNYTDPWLSFAEIYVVPRYALL